MKTYIYLWRAIFAVQELPSRIGTFARQIIADRALQYRVLSVAALGSIAGVILVQSFVLNTTQASYQTKDQVFQPEQLSQSISPQVYAEGVDKVVGVNEQREFKLRIPKIGLDKDVVENVNPAIEEIYAPVITNYIAHGKYTRLPDEAIQDGNVYLFAHRDGYIAGRYVGIFKRLDELGSGDKAVISYAGKTYTYEFLTSFVITPQDTWVYTDQSAVPTLTLQTCENGQEQRLMVKFKLVSVV